MPKNKSSTARRRAQANARRVARNKAVAKQASILAKVGLLPANSAKQVAIPKGGREAMTAEQRTLRRKTVRMGKDLLPMFASPDGALRPKNERMQVKSVTREQAKKIKSNTKYTVVRTPDGYAVFLRPDEGVAPSGRIQPKMGSNLGKQFRINADTMQYGEDDREPELLRWLKRKFAAAPPNSVFGFVFKSNDGRVNHIHGFADAEGMFQYLEQWYMTQIDDDLLGYIMLVPIPKMREMRVATEEIRKREGRKKRKYRRMHELSPREQEERRQRERVYYALKKKAKRTRGN